MGREEEATNEILDNLRVVNVIEEDEKDKEINNEEKKNEEEEEEEEEDEEYYSSKLIEYADDFHKNFDYCLVFPLNIKIGYGYELTKESVEITMKLKSIGAIVFPYLSVQKFELFLLIRFPTEILKKYAHDTNFIMALDPIVAEDMCIEGDKKHKIAPILIPFDDKKKGFKYHPFLYMYGRFNLDVPEELYWRPEDEKDPFRLIVRIKLTKNIMQGPVRLGGANLVISKLIRDKVLLGAFPLHDNNQKTHLLIECIQPLLMPWAIPFADLNE